MKKLLATMMLAVSILTLCACAKEETVPVLKEEDIRAVCELSTLECYYNNVAKIEKKASNWFQKDRKVWIEYEGIARIGVDMSEMTISVVGNTITMTMPKAKILSIKPNEKKLTEDSYVCSADGWLIKNPITVDDQKMAITKGQEEMTSAVQNNKGLFERAERRAKALIENYIKQMSERIGQEYTITWKAREA